MKGEFLWDTMPVELRPNWKRVRDTKTDKKTTNKKILTNNGEAVPVNVVEKLKVLEQKEMKERTKDDDVKDANKDTDDEEAMDEMEDEEMDDENDYDNNYFDNGEAFNEEDDNLDDGPVY